MSFATNFLLRGQPHPAMYEGMASREIARNNWLLRHGGQGHDRRPQPAQRSKQDRARIVAQRTLDAIQIAIWPRGMGNALIPIPRASRAIPGLGAPKEGAIFEARSAEQSSGTLAHLPERKCSGLHIVSQLERVAHLFAPFAYWEDNESDRRCRHDASSYPRFVR